MEGRIAFRGGSRTCMTSPEKFYVKVENEQIGSRDRWGRLSPCWFFF